MMLLEKAPEQKMLNEISNQALIQYSSYIQGCWVHESSNPVLNGESTPEYLRVYNPATLSLLAQIEVANKLAINFAIESAAEAMDEWKKLSAKQRAKILNRWFGLILENAEDLATLITLEQGKPIREARAEIAYGASYIEWFAEQAKRVNGSIIPSAKDSQKVEVLKEPVGVVAAVTPWNFPNAMLARKVAPALAAGCSVVAKPAEETPLSALALASLSKEAGIPPGVFNVVVSNNPKAVGQLFCGHKLVRKLSFTGSTLVGKQLFTQSASSLKKLSLELGGNAPLIVCEDADMAIAAEESFNAKFRNSGQTCISANRFLVHTSRYDEFIEHMSQLVENVCLGAGIEEETTQGPLIHSEALNKVEELVRSAVNSGAKVLAGGKAVNLAEFGGYFYPPTLLSDVTPTMDIFNNEIFGPVVSITCFSTDEEAVELANSTEAGLAAYIFSESARRAHFYTSHLEFGMIGVNEGGISNEMAPFGGVKESGLGREGAEVGIDDYLQLKYVCTRL